MPPRAPDSGSHSALSVSGRTPLSGGFSVELGPDAVASVHPSPKPGASLQGALPLCKKRRKGAGPGWCPVTHLWPEIGAPGILGAVWGDRELAKARADEWGVRGGSRLGGRNVHPASCSHPVACCLDGSGLSPDCCVQPCPEARSGVTGGGAFKPTAWPGPAAAVFLGPCLEFGGPRGWRDGIEGLCAAGAVSRPGEGSLATTGLHRPFSSRPGGRGEHPGPARPWPVLGLLVQSRSGPILASRGSVRIQTPLSPLRSHTSPPPSSPTACPPSCCLRVASAVTSCVFLRCPVTVPGLTACCVCAHRSETACVPSWGPTTAS